MKSEQFAWTDPTRQTARDQEYLARLETLFQSSQGTLLDKMRAFPKFVPVGTMGRFLLKHEIFRKILHVQGSIVECGVYTGAGLMTWASFSAIHEPLNHMRRVIGFDTFAGFPSIAEQDRGHSALQDMQVGGLFADTFDEITECARTFDLGRPLGHIPKIQLVRGDACRTLPTFIEHNQHFVCALLYLDFDIYEPTKVALETMLPRMPKGAIIAFDEMNVAEWPGETRAVLDVVGLKNLRIQRVPYSSAISYAVIE